MRWLALASFPIGWVFGQATPPSDPSPIVQWGVAGVLLSFILWLYMDERREHKALRKKVVDEVIPAILASTEQTRAATEVARESSRTFDPRVMTEWTSILQQLKRKLDG